MLRGRLRAGDYGGERLGGTGDREESAEMERNNPPGVFSAWSRSLNQYRESEEQLFVARRPHVHTLAHTL